MKLSFPKIRFRRLPSRIAGATAILITCACFFAAYDWQNDRTQSAFVLRASGRVAAVESALEQIDVTLQLLRLLFQTDEDVSDAEFREYVSPLQSRTKGFIGLASLESPNIPPGTEHVASFKTIRAVPKDFVGRDLLANLPNYPELLVYADKSLRTQEPMVADLHSLHSDASSTTILIFLPWHRDVHNTENSRDDRGVLISVLDLNQVMNSALDRLLSTGIHLMLEQRRGKKWKELAFWAGHVQGDRGAADEISELHPELHYAKILPFFGTSFRVRGVPTRQFLSLMSDWSLWPLFVVGIGASVLLALYVEQLLLRNAQIEETVARRTADLESAQSELRALAAEIMVAGEKERHRISSEIHGGIVQELALARIHLDAVRDELKTPSQMAQLDSAIELLRRSIGELRAVLTRISPPMLYDLGLVPAIEWLVDDMTERQDLNCQLTIDDTHDWTSLIPEETAIALFQVIRELLTNIVKHAPGMESEMVVSSSDSGVRIEASNVVIKESSLVSARSVQEKGGFGLIQIREQLKLIGGAVHLELSDPKEFRVIVDCPVKKDNASRRQGNA